MSAFEAKCLERKIGMIDALPMPMRNVLAVSSLLRAGELDRATLVRCLEHCSIFLVQCMALIYREQPDRPYVYSVEDILNTLGIDRMFELVHSLPLVDNFDDHAEQEWEHAFSCEILMRHLLKMQNLECPTLAVAARFHDLGHHVFRKELPRKFAVVNAEERDLKMPRYRIERNLLPMSHGEAGALLLRHWCFPEHVWKPVSYHHTDTIPPDFIPETAFLQFVDWIDSCARGIPYDEPVTGLLATANLNQLNASELIEQQQALIRRYSAAFQTIKDRMMQRAADISKTAPSSFSLTGVAVPLPPKIRPVDGKAGIGARNPLII